MSNLQPWQRDPTGLFYTKPGTEYAESCLFGCGALIAWVAITGALYVVAGPVLAGIAAIAMFVLFWNWDSIQYRRLRMAAAKNRARVPLEPRAKTAAEQQWEMVEQQARVNIALKAAAKEQEMRDLRSLLPPGWTLTDPRLPGESDWQIDVSRPSILASTSAEHRLFTDSSRAEVIEQVRQFLHDLNGRT